jgi:serine/threonine protein kinase
MSPEQMRAKPVDHRSDIFALGSVAYEVLSYERAFKGGLNDGLLQRLPYENPTALSQLCPGLPVGLEGIIVRAMQKAPDDRFQDLAEMRNAVVEIQRRFDSNEEERTLLLPRDDLDETGSDGDEPVPVLVNVPPAWVPNPTSAVVFPEPSADVEPPPTPAKPVVPEMAWSAKKKEDTSLTPRPKAAVKAPPRPPNPTPQRRPPSPWRLGIAAAAAIVLAGAAVAIPWPAADPLVRERPGIESALERFRIAYRNRDIDAVVSAFPAVPRPLRQRMERTFRDCLIYELLFDAASLQLTSVDPSHVRADVASTHTCTPQSGGPERSTSGPEVYALEKIGEGWRITDITLATDLSARSH